MEENPTSPSREALIELVGDTLQAYAGDDNSDFEFWPQKIKAVLAEDMLLNLETGSLQNLSLGDPTTYRILFSGYVRSETLVVTEVREKTLLLEHPDGIPGAAPVEVFKTTGVSTQGPHEGWITIPPSEPEE